MRYHLQKLKQWSSKFIKKWLGVPNSLTNVALYSSSTKLKLPTLSLVEEYKLGKAWLSRHTGKECPAFCDNQSEMEGKNSCWECWIGHQDERNNWHCGKWKSRSRLTSTALVVQRIHGKQKKNGVGRNSSSWSSAFCYNCRKKGNRVHGLSGRMQKTELSHGETLSTWNQRN